MAKKQSTSTPAVEAPQKPATEEVPKREPITDPDELIQVMSRNWLTVEHINRATEHIRELSMMLYEAQDGGTSGKQLQNVARAIQDLMGTYADEIDDCTEYFSNLVKDAHEITKQGEKGGAE